jgi:UDP-N-acetylmuramoylalanine-D-glutamate ligase
LRNLEEYFNIKLRIPDGIDIQIINRENAKAPILEVNESEEIVENLSKKPIHTTNIKVKRNLPKRNFKKT